MGLLLALLGAPYLRPPFFVLRGLLLSEAGDIPIRSIDSSFHFLFHYPLDLILHYWDTIPEPYTQTLKAYNDSPPSSPDPCIPVHNSR